jgi:hypothetical protein
VRNRDGLGAAVLGWIDEVVERVVAQGRVPGVVAAVARGESVHVAMSGVTAAVGELLPEWAGRRVLRSPDGPLGQAVPAQWSITVRDLLTFTWGFGMQAAMFMAPEARSGYLDDAAG